MPKTYTCVRLRAPINALMYALLRGSSCYQEKRPSSGSKLKGLVVTKYIGVQYDISIPFQKQVRNDFSVSDRSRRRISSTAFPVTLAHEPKNVSKSSPAAHD